MQIDMNRFLDTFFQESEEHVAAIESGLLTLEQADNQQEVLHEIFRAAHSIKGSSGSFGFEAVTAFTHAMESLLDRMRSGETPATRERTGALLQSVDVLRSLLAAARSGTAGPEMSDVLLLLEAQQAACVQPGPPVGKAGAKTYRVRFRPSREVFRQGMDPVLVLRSLGRLGEVRDTRLDVSALPGLESLEPEECFLGWTLLLITAAAIDDIRDVFAFVEDGAEISIEPECAAGAETAIAAPAPRGPLRDSASIRVSTGKVDRLIDLVGELVIAQSMAAQILNGFSMRRLPDLQTAFANLERYTRELQERVMSVRMVPVGAVFSRFPRLVRDLSAAMGKDIALEMTGEETELDKLVVERMGDPLTHLVRNAIDHGIESAEQRRAAGKPEQGRLELRAYHQGGNVLIEVADDGGGLSAGRIRAKAIERGLISEAEPLDDQRLCQLIFQPGFSTADKISDVSGRGVGLDVVKSEVTALGGTVSVETRPGRGTRMLIQLPLTLAILDGLLLRVGAQTYILPLLQILESICPRREQCNRLAGQGEVILVRGEPIPLLRLHQLFGIPGAVTDPSQGLVVLVEQQGRRMALLVDELLGQQQVVIKSLETNYRKVEGVAGATILGDGQPALIVDIAGLVQLAQAA